MAPWWLYGGYVFPIVVKLENLTFKSNLPLKVEVNCTQNNRDLDQCILHLWSKFGDLSLNGWWVMVRTSSKWGKFRLWPLIWPWRSRLIAPQNNRDLNQDVLRLWSKFGDPSLNGWWVIARTNMVTDGRTDRGNDNTRGPKLASGKKGPQIILWPLMGPRRVATSRLWFYFHPSKIL